MTQPFADALTWVPKSRALSASLSRAHDLARARAHPVVSLEHLLLSLIEDPDAASLLLSCHVDLLGLNATTTEHLQQQPSGTSDLPEAAPALLTILEYAVAAARQSKRSDINGAIVLAAIVGEGKSDAARLLQAGGLKFEDAVQALRRAVVPKPVQPEMPPPTLAQTIPQHAAAFPAAAGEQTLDDAVSEPKPRSQPSPPEAVPTVNGHYAFDDDPVTTARRRIAAIRSGQPVPPLGAQMSREMPPPAQPPQVALPRQTIGEPAAAPETPSNGSSSDWAPSPVQQPVAPNARLPRLPPPVPPIADAPIRSNGKGENPAAALAPWDDGSVAIPEVQTTPPPVRAAAMGPPIEPQRLIERLPTRLQSRKPVTVEIRIARTAVLATGAAASGRDEMLTRAVAVRLRAPEGGFHIENAAPETQWFETKSSQRDDAEVRWRWLVTPHHPGRRPLQLSITMRAIASDGIAVETVLPEHQVTVNVGTNYAHAVRTWATYAAAALTGAMLAMLASGGWKSLLG